VRPSFDENLRALLRSGPLRIFGDIAQRLQESKAFAHHLAGVAEAAGRDTGLDEAVGQVDIPGRHGRVLRFRLHPCVISSGNPADI